MTEIMNWITANQTLLIVAIVGFVFLINKIINYKATSNPAIDRWDRWQPTSTHVANLVFQGAEWWGAIKRKSGDEKLQEYLKQLQAFETDFKTDKLQAVQKLIAWYLSLRSKAPAPNPLTALHPIGPEDVAESDSTSRSTQDA